MTDPLSKPLLFTPLKIGGLELRGNLFLAPIAGYSDIAYRSLCSAMGSCLNFSEMVSCEALYRGSQKTLELMKKSPVEGPLFIQFFTGTPDNVSAAMDAFNKTQAMGVDLNCGCPVPKVTKTGAGSSLLRDPDTIYKVIKAMKNNTDRPVTFKIRSGWDNSSLNFEETAQAGIEAGADMVSLHSRTRSQGYSGQAKREHIKRLKEISPLPVCASGDLISPEQARQTLEETGCDALMFARGVMGNPFIFRQTEELLTTGTYHNPTPQEKLKAAEKHLRMAFTYLPRTKAIKDMRKHLASYSKGIQGGAAFRNSIVRGESLDEYLSIIREFSNSLQGR